MDDSLRRQSKSKAGRDDAAQLVIGLVVTREGILLLRHCVFSGRTVDVATIREVMVQLKELEAELENLS